MEITKKRFTKTRAVYVTSSDSNNSNFTMGPTKIHRRGTDGASKEKRLTRTEYSNVVRTATIMATYKEWLLFLNQIERMFNFKFKGYVWEEVKTLKSQTKS